jgi:hypothetical protein
MSVVSAPSIGNNDTLGKRRFYLSKYKLSGVTELMSFMAGFSVISIAELNVESDDNEWLLTGYVLTTSLLVSIATFVIMVNSWIIPHFKSNDDELNLEILRTQDPSTISSFTRRVNRMKLDRDTRHFIQGAWLLASGGSVFLFTTNVIILCWIKFKASPVAPYAASGILCPFLLLLLWFGLMFRRRLMKNQFFQHTDFDDDIQNYCDNDSDSIGPSPGSMSTVSVV